MQYAQQQQPGQMVYPGVPQPHAQQQYMPPQHMPQQQCMVQQPQVSYGVDGFSVLNSVQWIKVSQKIEMLEAITGFETQNKYGVIDPSGKQIMLAKEDSDCLARNCCAGSCRPYNYDVELSVGLGGKFLHIERPFQCTMCCFNRPELTVYHAASNQILGYISDPWACCDMTFDIYDADRNKVLTMFGSCCQAGLFCPCPCDPCNTVEFDIKDAKTDAHVGSLKKTFRLANMFAASDADNYEIHFEQVSNPKWKAMLIALALFLDMNYFEKGGQEQRDASIL